MATSDFKHKIAFIVPTRNRPDLLKKLLRSIQDQTVKPHQVILVDGSDESIEPEIKQFLSSSVSYIRVVPPSLTKQRNEGLKALNEDITLVGYLDDDIVLERDAVETMLRFWEQCSEDVGGSSFNITNNICTETPILPRTLDKLFRQILGKLSCLDGEQGKVLRSGKNTSVSPVLKDISAEWLCGGATVWRIQILEDFRFDEWFAGWAYYEDIDFSFRVAQKYKLIVLFDARVQHFPPPFNPMKYYSFGKMNTIYRYYFVKKHAQLSILIFYWSALAEILINILSSIKRLNVRGIRLASGNITGLLHIIKRNLVQINENFRM